MPRPPQRRSRRPEAHAERAPRRRAALCATLLAGWLGVAAPAQAESLRCPGGIVGEGDSRLSLLHKCGPPLLADHHCAPLFDARSGRAVPEPWAGAIAGCQLVEELLYDRGSGNLMATVRVRAGVVQAIVYGQAPR